MAKGVNKVILVGRLGADPEVKYMPTGGAVANASLATSETWKDKSTGQPQEKTEWHRVVFFNRLGEIAGEYLRKGSMVYVEGSLRTRKWQAQDGTDRYTTEIVVSEMQMLDSKPQDGQPTNYQQPAHQPAQQAPAAGQSANQYAAAKGGAASRSHAPQPHAAQHQPSPRQLQQSHQQAPQYAHHAPPAGFDSFDDDIPF